MKDKIAKIINVFKKDGVFKTLKKLWKYFNASYGSRINIFSKIYYNMNRKKYESIVDDILKTSYDRIIIWRSEFRLECSTFPKTSTYIEKFG